MKNKNDFLIVYSFCFLTEKCDSIKSFEMVTFYNYLHFRIRDPVPLEFRRVLGT